MLKIDFGVFLQEQQDQLVEMHEAYIAAMRRLAQHIDRLAAEVGQIKQQLEQLKADEMGSYLLLTNHGYEGWHITKYATEDAMYKAIQGGQTYGNCFIVARELRLDAVGGQP